MTPLLQSESLSERQISGLMAIVEREFGLHFSDKRKAEFERAIRQAAADLGYGNGGDLAAAILGNRAETLHRHRLAEYLTIGETYFYRYPKTFEVLEQVILPAFVGRRLRGQRRIRVWSAGCSTGEEAYSIAIALDRVLPNRSGWTVEVIGTDLNTAYLEQARRGIYTSWSFRSAPEWLLSNYFRSLSGNKWELSERIRSMVEFRCENLALEAPGFSADGPNDFDIIFCRNVLLYFKQERVIEVIDRFHRRLSPNGILFLGASEASQQHLKKFEAHSLNGVMYYTCRQPEGKQPGSACPRVAPELGNERPAATKQARPTLDTAHASGSKLPDSPGIEELIGEGRLAEALRSANELIDADHAQHDLYRLRARVHLSRGDAESAYRDLRRCLYLKPDDILACFLCAETAVQCGHEERAIGLLKSSLNLLAELDKGDPGNIDTGGMRRRAVRLLEELQR